MTYGLCIALLLCLANASSAQAVEDLRPFPEDLPTRFGVVGLRAHAVAETLHVSKVRLHSPAADAGLRVGDRVLGALGVRLTDADQLSRLVQSVAPSDSVLFHVLRGSRQLDLPCRVTDRRHLYALMMESDDGPPPLSARHRNWDTWRQGAEAQALHLIDRHHAGGVIDTLTEALALELSRYGAAGRLADADYILRHPLKAPDAARAISRSFESSFHLRDYLAQVAAHLDLDPPQNPQHASAEDLDSLLLVPVQIAAQHVELAFEGLSEAEQVELRDGIEPLLRRFDRSFYLDEGDSAETESHIRTLRLAKRVHVDQLLQAALSLSPLTEPQTLDRVEAAARRLQPVTEELPTTFEGRFLHAEETPWGWFIIGDTLANVYAGPAAIIVDLGGDDTYLAGPGAPVDAPVALVIDLAGDDRYIGNRAGSLGGALAGVGLLVDRHGDDTYAGDVLTQGAAFCGVGVLWDAGGHDTYLAQHSSQGAGFFGAGLLIDHQGDDLLSLGQLGQGLGGAHGVGLLLDGGGRDRYLADLKVSSGYDTPGVYNGWSQGIGVGFRGYAPGGLGVLISAGDGDDTYQAGDFSQGTGYFFGLGILADSGGDDRYQGARYSQGSAAHQAAGILLDDAGDDIYHGSVGANQGAAWDAAIAVLVDLAGDDSYMGGGLSQGAAAMNGVGWLYDLAGDDSYRTGSGQADGGSTRYWGGRGALNLGLLIDSGGGDDYSRADRQDGGELRDSRVGLFSDVERRGN